jgi:hypothetical protein
MALGRDFTLDAVEGEQDALIGIQTRGGTILRGATVPPSPNNTAGQEGTKRTPGTGRERSPPSPVRSGHQDWPALQGTKQAARSRLGAPGSRQPEEDRNSPSRAAEGAPPGFTVLAIGPTLNIRPEWLSNPRDIPQRTPGENFGHEKQDARAGQMGALRPGVRNAPGEENDPASREKREPAPARLRFEEDEWGGLIKRQAPAKLEGLSDFLAQPQLPQGPPAHTVKEQSSSEVPVESHAGTGGGSASVSFNFPEQASRVEATFNPSGPHRISRASANGTHAAVVDVWTPDGDGAHAFPHEQRSVATVSSVPRSSRGSTFRGLGSWSGRGSFCRERPAVRLLLPKCGRRRTPSWTSGVSPGVLVCATTRMVSTCARDTRPSAHESLPTLQDKAL